MKRLFIFFLIFTAVSLTKCSQHDNAKKAATEQPDRIEKVDDSTICHSYELNDGHTEMFYLSNGDTTSHVRTFVTEYYSNYTFFSKGNKVTKIKQYLLPVGIKEHINEIVHFTPEGVIDTSESTLLTFVDLGDSILLRADNNRDIFDKTRVLIGDSTVFDLFSWKNPDRFESATPYVTISKSIKGRKCVFQRITTDDKGADKSGYDIYFDIENLLCRDISKTLVCRTK